MSLPNKLGTTDRIALVHEEEKEQPSKCPTMALSPCSKGLALLV